MGTSSSAIRPSGGLFASDLNTALDETLDRAGVSLIEISTADWTVEQLARTIASTPPFSEALVGRVRRHLSGLPN